MTAEQKNHLASFLDLTADALRGGYTQDREPYAFTDSPSPSVPAPQASAEGIRPLVMLAGEGLESGGATLTQGAAELLDKMLASIGLFRGKNCVSGSKEQIGAIRPQVILCMGEKAAREFFPAGKEFSRSRGRFSAYENIPVLATFHPNDLILNASLKRPAWEDLKTLRSKLMELDPGYAAIHTPNARSVTEGR